MIQVTGLTALDDNYIWLIQSDQPGYERSVWVVDPGESRVVQDYLAKHNLVLEGILITHHHYDHVDGVADLLAQTETRIQVIGSQGHFSLINQLVSGGDQIALLGETFDVLSTPGHTQEHITFLHPQAAFAGDTLFTAGCGRCFSGDYEAFANSLLQLRAAISTKPYAACQLYCGHEYTWANIHFALIAEPDNQAIIARKTVIQQTLLESAPCVPAALSLECDTNPFLRFDLAPLKTTLLQRLQQPTATQGQLFKALRDWKDALDPTGLLEPSLTETSVP